MKELKLFTSESVSCGHPDKLCDQISDAVLDACLAQDKNSRVACEVYATTNMIIIGGEITTLAKIDYEQIARDVIKDIGYDSVEKGLDYKTCEVKVLVKSQSPDIAQGVNRSSDNSVLGAGDQGIMFGYATNETEAYMPLAIFLSHRLVEIATELRKTGQFKWARPDMKSQVTIDYTDINNPKVHTILMSIQHDPDFEEETFKNFIKEKIRDEVVKKQGFNLDYKYFINPTGRFVIGGPEGDVGLTGRKIIVDTYGGSAKHGGGAFSGKDYTKVDRSAAYALRHIAKNIVASGLADRIEIQIAYAIGKCEPISICIDTFNTNHIDNDLILKAIKDNFDLTPAGIIKRLDLTTPRYYKLASFGHFGRLDLDLPWERLDYVDVLKTYLNK